MAEPEILIVDEVLAVGDMEFQKKCIGKMDKVSKNGRTVLFVSHNMGIISRLCQRGILLENGRIKLNDTIDSVVKNYLSIPTGSGDVDLSSLKERDGNGRALFTRITSRNWRRDVSDTFTIGDDLIFDITISNGSWISTGKMALMIISDEGIPIYHFLASDAGFEISNLKNNETIRIILKRLKLYPGNYFLNLWLGDKISTRLDTVQNALKFTVVAGGMETRNLDRSLGMIYEVPSWSIVS